MKYIKLLFIAILFILAVFINVGIGDLKVVREVKARVDLEAYLALYDFVARGMINKKLATYGIKGESLLVQ